MEKPLNLHVKDMNIKHVAINDNMLCPKTLGLCDDFSQGSCEMSETKPFPESTI